MVVFSFDVWTLKSTNGNFFGTKNIPQLNVVKKPDLPCILVIGVK